MRAVSYEPVIDSGIAALTIHRDLAMPETSDSRNLPEALLQESLAKTGFKSLLCKEYAEALTWDLRKMTEIQTVAIDILDHETSETTIVVPEWH